MKIHSNGVDVRTKQIRLLFDVTIITKKRFATKKVPPFYPSDAAINSSILI